MYVRTIPSGQRNPAVDSRTRAPMLAADIEQHPEYETVVWDLRPAKSGKLAVAKDRWGPLNIAYEVHGVGPTKLVVCHESQS